MAVPSVSAVDPHKKKSRKGARKGKRRSKSASRSTTTIMSRINAALGRGGPIVKSLKGPATVVGSGLIASAVNGWQNARGGSLKVYGVDLRLVTGLVGLGVGLYAPTKAWAPVVANIGTGALASWGLEQGYDRGNAMGKPAAAAATTSEGIVVGRIGKRIARVEKKEGKLEAKLEKLREKARRKGKGGEVSQSRARPGGPRRGGPKLIDNVPLSYILPQYRKQFASA